MKLVSHLFPEENGGVVVEYGPRADNSWSYVPYYVFTFCLIF